MKQKYKLLLELFQSNKGGWLCNTITNHSTIWEIEKDFKDRLRKIDKTDPDLWEQRPDYYKDNVHRKPCTPDEMVDMNFPFWTEPNDSTREEFLKRIIKRL